MAYRLLKTCPDIDTTFRDEAAACKHKYPPLKKKTLHPQVNPKAQRFKVERDIGEETKNISLLEENSDLRRQIATGKQGFSILLSRKKASGQGGPKVTDKTGSTFYSAASASDEAAEHSYLLSHPHYSGGSGHRAASRLSEARAELADIQFELQRLTHEVEGAAEKAFEVSAVENELGSKRKLAEDLCRERMALTSDLKRMGRSQLDRADNENDLGCIAAANTGSFGNRALQAVMPAAARQQLAHLQAEERSLKRARHEVRMQLLQRQGSVARLAGVLTSLKARGFGSDGSVPGETDDFSLREELQLQTDDLAGELEVIEDNVAKAEMQFIADENSLAEQLEHLKSQLHVAAAEQSAKLHRYKQLKNKAIVANRGGSSAMENNGTTRRFFR